LQQSKDVLKYLNTVRLQRTHSIFILSLRVNTEYTSKRSMFTSEAIPALHVPHIPKLMHTEGIFMVPANGCT